jgi:broad specificity phosphatase PhoE
MKIILIRHGETEENKAGIFQGHLPGKLSEEGIEQAKKVALRLKDEKIDHIFSSDLARAADTAKEIAKYHDVPIEFIRDIRERHMGEFQGKNKSELGWDPKKQVGSLIQPKEGETLEQLFTRTRKFIHRIISEHMNSTVLLVCHGGVGKVIIAEITGKPVSEIRAIKNLNNSSVSIFELDEDKNHNIHLYNCTEHLK